MIEITDISLIFNSLSFFVSFNFFLGKIYFYLYVITTYKLCCVISCQDTFVMSKTEICQGLTSKFVVIFWALHIKL